MLYNFCTYTGISTYHKLTVPIYRTTDSTFLNNSYRLLTSITLFSISYLVINNNCNNTNKNKYNEIS